jgi:colanic acid biosynthesis glycosyl transferase WcaI
MEGSRQQKASRYLKILLLNQTFYPDVVSTAQHLSDLAAALVKRGHQVTVITGRRAYDEPKKIFTARENWQGVRIFRVFSTRFGKAAKWRRAADFASFIFSCCFCLLFLSRQDVVVALTTPPLISFVGAWRAKLWRAKFCYWVMDMNPDEAIAAGWLRQNSMVGKLLERMSRFSLRQAGSIIGLDRFMRDRIVAKGIAPDKIAVIPPWSHDNEVNFNTTGRDQFRREHGLENKFVIMYAGNHSPIHPLDTLLQAAEQLKNDGSIAFCFIGGGQEFPRVKRWGEDWAKADNGTRRAKILCLPYQPLACLSAMLSAADAHVVVMGNPFVGLVHPCKIYNILTIGAPLIYIGPVPGHVPEILNSLGDQHMKAAVAHGDVDFLVREIRRLGTSVNGIRMPLTDSPQPFSKDVALTKMIQEIEKAPGR